MVKEFDRQMPLVHAPAAKAAPPAPAGTHPLLALHRRLGNRAVTQMVQARLKIGPADDPYEHEADQVADQVMRTPVPAPEKPAPIPPFSLPITPFRPARLQRQPVDGTAAELDADVAEETEPDVEEVLQTKSLGNGHSPNAARLADALQRSRGQGQPIPALARTFMERRFGADFSQVTIHTGSEAAWMNSALGARAFTYGRDIYFQQGEYSPATIPGQQLLAHELTHVVQQTGRVMRKPAVPAQVQVNLHSQESIQRSQALYFSTHGKQGYFRYAERFHREHGFPAPVRVSSVEEMLEHMVTLARPIQFVRLVTHAVPDGIFLPLLRGGGTTLFSQDMELQRMSSLERELAVEHPTLRQGQQFVVVTSNYHVAPRDWVRQAWLEINWTRGGPDVLIEHRLLLADAPDPDRGPVTDLEMHSLFWWALDRELITAQREQTDRRGRTRLGYVFNIPARDRQILQQTFNRNFELFRDRLIATRWGTRAAFDRLEAMIVRVAPRLIDRALAGRGLQLQYTLPQARYASVQGAVERGTYADNLLRAKFWLANGAGFQIRGCRIGQNVPWLETFRDFLGHGEQEQRSRPDVSAPDLRHAFGVRSRRAGRRRITESLEWLQDGRRQIHTTSPEFEQHIVHVR